MVKDIQILQAATKILQRSERQEDIQKLLSTFVDIGILPQLLNRNNQILYGRRGTGKTHILKVLSSRLQTEKDNAVVYIDARTLGSSAQFSDFSLPISIRCLALFRDILAEVYHLLLEYIVEHPSKEAEKALVAIDDLQTAFLSSHESISKKTILETDRIVASDNEKANISITPHSGFKIDAGISAGTENGRETQAQYQVSTEDKIIFPDIHRSLRKALDLADVHLYILIDEWSSLPQDIQPYLAEFIKRSILPIPKATIKIASLEYRSHFDTIERFQRIGFELGADISAATDLDEYYVYDRNPVQLTRTYADMIFRHVMSELPEKYLLEKYKINNGQEFVLALFTGMDTFQELARASEGVVRDLINILCSALYSAQRRDRGKIEKQDILKSALQWFEQDKAHHIDEDLHRVLQKIVDEVIGNRKARSFLLPRKLENHPVIQRLFDARVLHHIQRGYVDKDNPGVRYNIYTLDYGTYVGLKGTSKEPEKDFTEAADNTSYVVPFDDKRSIRRIILDEKVLSLS
jgi:hypothetical protein